MNKFLFILSAVCILFFSCNFSGDNSNDYAYYKVAPRTEDSQFSVSGSGLKIDMISVLNTDAIVLGEDVESVTKNVQVVPFSMSKFEVSYNVWRFVYSWATSDLRGNKKYTFENAGAEGQYGDLSSSKLFNEGGEPQDEGIPVCGINWCNALSELCGLAPVYFTDSDFKNPLRNSIYAEGESPSNIPLPYGNAKATDMTSLAKGNVDNPYVNKNADGFRLPYLYEWEYAARKCEDGSFISGRNAPGDKTGPCNGSTKPTLMDEIMGIEFVAQSKVAKNYGWNMSNSMQDGPNKTAAGWDDRNSACKIPANGGMRIHKQGGKLPSKLGFYDLAGNAYEWCYDFGSPYDWKYEVYPYKSMKQGGYNASYSYFESCYRRADPSYVKTGGLRLARNAE
ncbi:SUMF1/EgtB/PvdO family nonheme iron enzyme [uncultured Treponema sp.]|uniref:SUMF1/EgtB/PvdO family nonheme iron enzyme n=1 Tax=uncultured Treponema sp. TaxID=162155 RepID=UPI00280A887F|nr:SUMF1/EgtB/PvdO family nonheme iron enzyme [uncultured Treponema sp.]